MMSDDLPSLFLFDRWANARVIDACRKLSDADYKREPVPGWASTHTTMVHIAAGTDAWSRRFEAEDVTSLVKVDQVPSLDAVAQLLEVAYGRIDRLLAVLTFEGLTEVRTFLNSKREAKRFPMWAALRHVVNHATYHRGQVASKLKLLGVEPPITDFAAWAFEQTEPKG